MSKVNSAGRGLGVKNIRLLKNERLGRGAYGQVCKAQCDQLICAAKIIYDVLRQAAAPDPGREHRQPQNRFQSEIEFLKSVHHPNIVQYLGTYEDPDSGDLVLLMELMDESLTNFLERSPGDIPYHIQVNLSYDIAQALAFLHANGIIHRDLSSNNVLLLAGARAKVTDFGMSKFMERNVSMTLSPGTPAFMPPEALSQPPVYTEKLDNFSFGVLLVQIITKKFPEPTKHFETVRIPNPRNPGQSIEAKIDVPEVDRRRGHISLIKQNHPLLPMALDCLKNTDQERPSSQELCARLRSVKISDAYMRSSQQDPSHTVKEQLQAQHQQYQLEIGQMRARLEQATQAHRQELASKERQLQSLNEQLVSNEQRTATLQKVLTSKDRQVSELREMLAAKESQVSAANRLQSTQQLFDPLESITTPRATPTAGFMRWESLADAPFEVPGGSSAVIGDKVYIYKAGIYETPLIDQFNINTQQWSTLPVHPISLFTMVSIENTLTTVGGFKPGRFAWSNYSNKIYSFMYEKWTESLPQMRTRRMRPGAVYANNTLVVAGGHGDHDEGFLDGLCTVEVLNTVSRQWSSVSSLPFPISGAAHATCVHGDHVYIHMQRPRPRAVDLIFKKEAQDESPKYVALKCSLKALAKSKPTSELWKEIAPVPVSGSTLTSANGHLIAVGGIEAETKSSTNLVHLYNETTGSWNVVSRFSVARHACVTALLPDKKLMVIGGHGDNRKTLKSIEIATFAQ